MKRLPIIALLLLPLFFGSAQAAVIPKGTALPSAHSHNDYEQKRPLLLALEQGFCSVEADVYLINSALLVGHDLEDLKPERTLEALYLQPLLERVKHNGGRVHPNGPSVTLLIDFKSDGALLYQALKPVLEKYREMLTVFTPTSTQTNAVTVIISGDRPREVMLAETERLVGFDGRMPDLDAGLSPHFMPLVSDSWLAHFRWNGQGTMPDNERAKLKSLVDKAHQGGYRLRFWASPDNVNTWKELQAAGADYINTDHLAELSNHLRGEVIPYYNPFVETPALELKGDIASLMVDGINQFLQNEHRMAAQLRTRHWQRDFSTPASYIASLEPNRKRLAHILGVRDARYQTPVPEFLTTTERPAFIGRGNGFEVYAVRWPVFGGVHGEGLLLQPKGANIYANVIVIPDADQTPEQIAGLQEGIPASSQMARRLAESGCRVLVPTLISRQRVKRNGGANLTNREFIYRPAFEMGRHVIGYEVQKVLAGVDWFKNTYAQMSVGVAGYGEGGLVALHAAALDIRIQSALVSGYFGAHEKTWEEPIDRNVFGWLDQFGNAELAGMITPRKLTVEAALGPELNLAGEGGAPAKLTSPTLVDTQKEFARAQAWIKSLNKPEALTLVESGADGRGAFGSDSALKSLLAGLNTNATVMDSGKQVQTLVKDFPTQQRQTRQVDELDAHTQKLLLDSPKVRAEFMSKLSMKSVPEFEESMNAYREMFRHEIIGHFDQTLLPPNPRARLIYDEPKWAGYEIVLDVFPDVIAYGVLLLPKDLQANDRRPVVVCQHGLEGRPQDTIIGNHWAYHDYAARLAERGFVVFAPQNPYIFEDRFRVLQRMANPLGKTLFSVIVRQHEQITQWLQTLPFVDGHRIAFYGLSYGGKTAMRVPALVTDYSLSICSADFNEWIWKNASTKSPYSYVWTGEYEIFEFDLGNTFNYAEMAALIAPRPFMVERGHDDGVAPDETVAYEYAKVRRLYTKLGIPQRTEIEFFNGPHTIHGQGTARFLHQNLYWPAP